MLDDSEIVRLNKARNV